MSTSDPADRTLTVGRSACAREAARVRHVDELSDDAERRFYESVAGGNVAVDGGEFVDGELIVFTDYYRVDLS